MTYVIVLQEHTPGTPHHSGTPLENSGTPWGVRYSRLTSTDLKPPLRSSVEQIGDFWNPNSVQTFFY